jgi:hypothetical protein
MRFFVLVVFALAALARPAAAQLVDEDSVVEYDRSSILETSMLISTAGLNFANNLQDMLAQNGYSRFSNVFQQTAVFGVYYRWGRVKAGFSGGFDLPNINRNGQVWFTSQRVFTTIRLGYSVLNTRNRRFFVNLGFGAFEWLEQVQSPNSAGLSANWADLQARRLPNQTGVFLRNRQGVLDVSVEMLMRERKPNSTRLNYRIGYSWGLNPQAWEAPGLTLTDAPVDRLQRIYFEVNIGLVRSRNKR